MAEIIVGIDLGTTNSEVAVVRDGQPMVLSEDDDPIVPSFVGLAEDGRLLVGQAAKNQWALRPERTIRSIKRQMGQDVQVTLGETSYSPQEISAMILRTLKQRAERELGQEVRKAVITVPANFNDSQRQATREAGELAGLEVVRILTEPTAAALTYNPQVAAGETPQAEHILVYDLGGGTFDVSIVHAEHNVLEVKASKGDAHLGGDDFDELLVQHVCEQFLSEHDIDLRQDRVAQARLLEAVERAKRQLSDHAVTRLEEEFLASKDGVALHLDLELSRDNFEAMIRPLLDRTMDCLQQALDDARLTAREIDQVVLVGGSTRIPLIGQLLEARLGQPPHREVHPDLCVALGAAVQAAIIAGENVGAILIDITPHSLGIRCLEPPSSPFAMPFEHRFAPIVLRNTPLPTSRSEIFTTVIDQQEKVEVDVYQGEHEDVRNNHRIGKFVIEGLAPVPAGNQLVVQLALTLDGTLRVTAREKATGLSKEITIENAIGRLPQDQMLAAQRRLQRLWETEAGAEDDYEALLTQVEDAARITEADAMPELIAGPSEGQRESVQARALLDKAAQLRPQSTPEDQQDLDQLCERLQVGLADRNWPAVQQACAELSDVLFYLEDV